MTASPSINKTLIVIPTFNEAENLPVLLPQLRALVPFADLLIVDDSSPDGTGALADRAAAGNTAIHVLHRASKDGLGRAYIAGFTWGLERDYSFLVQMDADLSHDPKAVPALLAPLIAGEADLALGSRYVPGGGTVNWGAGRRFLSRFGSLYSRIILGLPVQDLTGGFKAWRRQVLEDIALDSVRSNGYSFQIEMTYRACLQGHRLREIPIRFADRVDGRSKMSKKIILEAVTMVWRLRAAAPAIRAGANQRRQQAAGKPVNVSEL